MVMLPNPPPVKVLLTYPDPGYARLCIYFSITLLAYLCIWLANGSWVANHPGVQAIMTNQWWPLIVISTLGISFFAGVLEGLFLFGQKFDPMKLEFDADNLYITVSRGQRIIPLQEIYSFRLIYGKRLIDNSRIPLYRYAIRFGARTDPEEVRLTIFRRTAYTFADFLSLVQARNPAVEIKNSATNWD